MIIGKTANPLLNNTDFN